MNVAPMTAASRGRATTAAASGPTRAPTPPDRVGSVTASGR